MGGEVMRRVGKCVEEEEERTLDFTCPKREDYM